MGAITNAGFAVPGERQSVPGSNVARDKHYDWIAYYRALSRSMPTGRAGVFDFFAQVYRSRDESSYAAERAAKRGRSVKDGGPIV